jgi:uncharacterized protein (DUF362 family)
MAKGASIKFSTYKESVPKLLELLNLQAELKKYDKIILKPSLISQKEFSTSPLFVEHVLKFCLEHKNPVSDVLIAEGAEEDNTSELFESLGYQTIAEKYGIGLVDLNNSETVELENPEFLRFSSIHYPEILRNSFLISLPNLVENEETGISTSISNMLGTFPSSHYSGFFSHGKNKIRKWPIQYTIHDIIKCNTPNFSIIDASEHGSILAGLPLDVDKQATKLLGKEWTDIKHLKLLDESLYKEDLTK